MFQSALRFAVVSDFEFRCHSCGYSMFQSALRFAVVSDHPLGGQRMHYRVSIRFEVRGGFRLEKAQKEISERFQSALRFAVVSDSSAADRARGRYQFQSALRFAVVSDIPNQTGIGG